MLPLFRKGKKYITKYGAYDSQTVSSLCVRRYFWKNTAPCTLNERAVPNEKSRKIT